MIISIKAEKASDKIQHTFTIKTLRKLGQEGNFLNLVRNRNKKPTVKTIHNDFPLRLGRR